MVSVSIDTDSVAANAAEWRDYAGQLVQHGTHPVSPAQLDALLGDVYAPYVDAKVAEHQARQAAYGRVAASAQAHADNLDNTVQVFTAADQDAGQRLAALGTEVQG